MNLHVTNVEKTLYFCPYCGKITIWVETGPGDYYEGPSHHCSDCFAEFTLNGG